jgi:hypothetical protein
LVNVKANFSPFLGFEAEVKILPFYTIYMLKDPVLRTDLLLQLYSIENKNALK